MVLNERPAMLRAVEGLPPHDIAAEEAVVAALLLDADHCAEEGVFAILGGPDFFREQNGWVFEAARAVHGRGETVTWVTVSHELRGRRLEQAGGEPYLTDLLAKHFTAIGASAHARIVAADSMYRRLIAAAGQISQMAYEGTPARVDLVLETAERLLRGIREGNVNIVPAAHRFLGGFTMDCPEER